MSRNLPVYPYLLLGILKIMTAKNIFPFELNIALGKPDQNCGILATIRPDK
jgi:hypothetical protein